MCIAHSRLLPDPQVCLQAGNHIPFLEDPSARKPVAVMERDLTESVEMVPREHLDFVPILQL